MGSSACVSATACGDSISTNEPPQRHRDTEEAQSTLPLSIFQISDFEFRIFRPSTREKPQITQINADNSFRSDHGASFSLSPWLRAILWNTKLTQPPVVPTDHTDVWTPICLISRGSGRRMDAEGSRCVLCVSVDFRSMNVTRSLKDRGRRGGTLAPSRVSWGSRRTVRGPDGRRAWRREGRSTRRCRT